MTNVLPALLACIAFAAPALAADGAAAPAPKPKPYTLDTCVVTGEKIGSMGDAIVVVREGREIKFCCRGCIKDFDKDPAKYLKKIDDAEQAKAAAKPEAAPHH